MFDFRSDADDSQLIKVTYHVGYAWLRGLIASAARTSTAAWDVPVHDRAHPLSVEFKVEALPRECFDLIEFWS